MTGSVPELYRYGVERLKRDTALVLQMPELADFRQGCMQGFQRISCLSAGGGVLRPIAALPDATKTLTSTVLQDLQSTKTVYCCTNHHLHRRPTTASD